jgi:hypothetical protein
MFTMMKRITLACLIALAPVAVSAQTDPCDDLAGYDFGDCEAVLGWGNIGGDCQLIVGCDSPVPLFATQAECAAACLEPTCDDLAGIDFGPCDAILGAGVIDGYCAWISGCGSPVALFADVTECAATCGVIAGEAISWGRVKARYGG